MDFYRTKNVPDKTAVKPGKAGCIKYYQKSAYGVNRMYVSDPVQQAAIYDLTGVKTLLPMHLQALWALGFKVVEVAPPLSE